MVDSLEHFPEIVGERIYLTCMQYGYFAENNTTTEHIIHLFVSAYGQKFMQCIQCHSHQLINEFCESLIILCLPLTHLDLHGCLLGNNNDILRVLVKIENLKVLNLSLNELSDDGFRTLLARHKMYKRGFQVLETLDVSENTVSIRTLRSLLRMPKLRNLRVSVASSLKFGNSQFTQEWTTTINYHNFDLELQDRKVAGDIETKGWGINLIRIWENKLAEWETARQAVVAKRSQSFYGHSLRKAKVVNSNRSSSNPKFDTYTYVRRGIGHLPLVMDIDCQSSGLKKGQSYIHGEVSANKMRQNNGDRHLQEMGVAAKRQKMEDEDMELFRIYLAT